MRGRRGYLWHIAIWTTHVPGRTGPTQPSNNRVSQYQPVSTNHLHQRGGLIGRCSDCGSHLPHHSSIPSCSLINTRGRSEQLARKTVGAAVSGSGLAGSSNGSPTSRPVVPVLQRPPVSACNTCGDDNGDDSEEENPGLKAALDPGGIYRCSAQSRLATEVSGTSGAAAGPAAMDRAPAHGSALHTLGGPQPILCLHL